MEAGCLGAIGQLQLPLLGIAQQDPDFEVIFLGLGVPGLGLQPLNRYFTALPGSLLHVGLNDMGQGTAEMYSAFGII